MIKLTFQRLPNKNYVVTAQDDNPYAIQKGPREIGYIVKVDNSNARTKKHGWRPQLKNGQFVGTNVWETRKAAAFMLETLA